MSKPKKAAGLITVGVLVGFGIWVGTLWDKKASEPTPAEPSVVVQPEKKPIPPGKCECICQGYGEVDAQQPDGSRISETCAACNGKGWVECPTIEPPKPEIRKDFRGVDYRILLDRFNRWQKSDPRSPITPDDEIYYVFQELLQRPEVRWDQKSTSMQEVPQTDSYGKRRRGRR